MANSFDIIAKFKGDWSDFNATLQRNLAAARAQFQTALAESASREEFTKRAGKIEKSFAGALPTPGASPAAKAAFGTATYEFSKLSKEFSALSTQKFGASVQKASEGLAQLQSTFVGTTAAFAALDAEAQEQVASLVNATIAYAKISAAKDAEILASKENVKALIEAAVAEEKLAKVVEASSGTILTADKQYRAAIVEAATNKKKQVALEDAGASQKLLADEEYRTATITAAANAKRLAAIREAGVARELLADEQYVSTVEEAARNKAKLAAAENRALAASQEYIDATRDETLSKRELAAKEKLAVSSALAGVSPRDTRSTAARVLRTEAEASVSGTLANAKAQAAEGAAITRLMRLEAGKRLTAQQALERYAGLIAAGQAEQELINETIKAELFERRRGSAAYTGAIARQQVASEQTKTLIEQQRLAALSTPEGQQFRNIAVANKIAADRIANEDQINRATTLIARDRAALAAGSTSELGIQARRIALDKELQSVMNRRVAQEIKNLQLAGEISGGTWFQRLQARIAGRMGGTGTAKLPADYQTGGQFLGGKLLTTAGFAVSGAVFFGLYSGIRQVAEQAVALERNFALIKVQLDAIGRGNEFDQLRQGVLSTARETGIAADQLAFLAYQMRGAFSDLGGGKGGISYLNDQLDAAAKIARVTLLPLSEITDSLTGIATTFDVDFRKIGDVALALQGRFGVLAKEIITFAADIGPVARQAGASFEDLATIGASLQRVSGRSGAALAESLGRILGSVQEKSVDILLTYQQLGPGFEDSNKRIQKALSKGLTFQALEQILRDFGKIQKANKAAGNALIESLGGRREAPTLSALLGDLSRQAVVGIFDKGLKETGSLNKAYEQLGKTLQQQFMEIKQSFLQLGVAIAQSGIIPLLKDLAGAFELVLSIITPLLGLLQQLTGVMNQFSGGNITKLIEAIALVQGAKFLFAGRTGGALRPGPTSIISRLFGTRTAATGAAAAVPASSYALPGGMMAEQAATTIGMSTVAGGIFSKGTATALGTSLGSSLASAAVPILGTFAVLTAGSLVSSYQEQQQKDIDKFTKEAEKAVLKQGLDFKPKQFAKKKDTRGLGKKTEDAFAQEFSGFYDALTDFSLTKDNLINKIKESYKLLNLPLRGINIVRNIFSGGDTQSKKIDAAVETFNKYRNALIKDALLSNEKITDNFVLSERDLQKIGKDLPKGLKVKKRGRKYVIPELDRFVEKLATDGSKDTTETWANLVELVTQKFGKKYTEKLIGDAKGRFLRAAKRQKQLGSGIANQLPIDPESIKALFESGTISYTQMLRQLSNVERVLQAELKGTKDPKARADVAKMIKQIQQAEKEATADVVANEIDYALKLRDLAGGVNVNQYHLALVLRAFRDPRLKGTKGFEVREKLVADAYDALKGILQEQIDAASDAAEALAIGTKGIAVPEELQTQALALNIERAIQTSSIKVGQLKKFAHIFRTGYTDFINQVAQIMVASHLKLGEAVKVWAQARIAELQQAQKDINAALYSAFVAIQQAMLAGPIGILRAVDAATRLQNLGQKSEQINKDLKAAQDTLNNLAKMQFPEPAPVADTVKGDIPSLQNAANDAAGTAEDQAKAARDLAEARLNYLLALVENDPVKAAEIAIQKADIAAQFAETEADRINAAADRIRAERQLREAQFDVVKAMGEYSIAVAELAGDSVKAAQLQLDSLQRQLAFAQAEGAGAAEIGRLQADILRQQREVENAILDVMAAQGELAVAIADAAGNTVEAARIQLETLQRQLQSLLEHGGAGTADAIRLQADIVRQQAALRDAALQEKMDTIDFNLEVEKISKQQAIAQYEALLSNADILQLTEQQRRDLILRIKQLKDSLNQDLQFNLPSELRLPTLYEARRLNQTGGMYQDNRTYTISLSSTDPASTQQAVDQIVTEINSPPLYGSTTRIY